MSRTVLYYLICFLSLSFCRLNAQTLDEFCRLDLPVIIINTVDGEIPTCESVYPPEGACGVGIKNATKVPCSVTIKLHGETLYESGEFQEDKSGAKIKIRGNTSAQAYPIPYKLKLQKKADLLLRGDDDKFKDKEWVLLSENCLYTYIGFTLNALLDMPYKPEFKLMNLFMNNSYVGLYYLVESVKRNEKCRIDVDKQTGYIFEYDAYWWNEEYYVPLESNSIPAGFTFKYPEFEDMTDEHKDYIEQWLYEMQLAVKDNRVADYLCLDTCARWVLAHDLLGTSDGAGSNLYFAKKDNTSESKAYTPTLWDFDSSFNTESEWSNPHSYPNLFFTEMFEYDKNGDFATAFCKEWLTIQNNNITQKLIQAIKKFANSEEGKAYEKTHLYHSKDFSISNLVEEYEEWFTEREQWMDNAIYNQYPRIINELKYGYTYPDVAFDILGRKIPAFSSHRIKVVDGLKYMDKP